MLYRFLNLLMIITTRVFFRSIKVVNDQSIPQKGPLIILANHPSTFMDPIVLATIIKRKIFFLGKGELFKTPLAKWLLPKLNIIPVYRKQDDPTLMNKNEETFKKCYEHLENNGVILIFPEGVSITERKLKPIKTGAARIALGAEARNDFKLGVKIINIGLNYDNPHKFNRNLFINIHSPIEVVDYKEKYKLNEFGTAEEITNEIKIQLEKMVISINDEKTDALVKDIETLYKHQLKKARGVKGNDSATEFSITQNIVKAIQYYSENDSAFVEEMRNRIKNYFYHLQELNLEDEYLSRNRSGNSFVRSNIKAFLFLIFGFPFYLYGLINNILPFEIPGWLATKITKSKDFKGSIAMVLGMFTFLIFYSIQIFLIHHFYQHIIITFLYAFSLPLSGMFTYFYWHTFDKIRAKWLLVILFYKRSTAIANVISERESIIKEFEKIREIFLQKFPESIK